MAVSGRHGTSTVDILEVFAAEIKFASLDATPPRAMKPTDPARLHTAEFTFVTRRFARESFSKLRGSKAIGFNEQPRPTEAPFERQRIRICYTAVCPEHHKHTACTQASSHQHQRDGSINNSSTTCACTCACCELECCKAQCAARKAATVGFFGLLNWQPPIEAREDGGVQSYCKIARACERFTAGQRTHRSRSV